MILAFHLLIIVLTIGIFFGTLKINPESAPQPLPSGSGKNHPPFEF